MGNVLSNLKKIVLGAMGVAGVTVVAYVVEHGDFPEWLRRLFSWVWAFLTLTTEWALWELLMLLILIGTPAIYFLYTAEVRINQLQIGIDQLEFRAKKLRQREQELVKSLEEHRLKAEIQVLDSTADPTLTQSQIELLLILARFENDNVLATVNNILRSSKFGKVILVSLLDDLKELQCITRVSIYLDVKYRLTPLGRKIAVSYMSI